MNTFKATTILILILFSTSASSEVINDIFGDGVFGVNWGATIDDVKESYNDGDIQSFNGITLYRIVLDKPVMGIDRSSSNGVTFIFDTSGRCYEIGIEFPDGAEGYGNLLMKMKTTFGEPIGGPGKYRAAANTWKSSLGITLSIVYIPGLAGSNLTLSINKELPTPKRITKEALGF